MKYRNKPPIKIGANDSLVVELLSERQIEIHQEENKLTILVTTAGLGEQVFIFEEKRIENPSNDLAGYALWKVVKPKNYKHAK